MKEYLITLSQDHAVNEFNDISGVVKRAKNKDELKASLQEYLDYMSDEGECGTVHVRELGTNDAFTLSYNDKDSIEMNI